MFNGTLISCSALYIKDANKFVSEAEHIKRSSHTRKRLSFIAIIYSNIELVIPFRHFRG